MEKLIEDLKLAKKILEQNIELKYFLWTYPFTNENIKGYYNEIDFNDKEVLVPTSSGDHAINALYKNAKSINCFDINPLAKYYSELKIAALKNLNYEEFIAFLYNKNKIICSSDYLNKGIYDYIKSSMEDKYRIFWDTILEEYSSYKISKSNFFTNDFLNIRCLKAANLYLKESNYYYTQKLLANKKIKYLDCNITDLDKLDRRYDIIILSNIPAYLNQFYENDDYLKNLKNLLNNIKKESSIIAVSYLYAELLNIPGALGIYNQEEVKKYFPEDLYEYIDVEKSNELHSKNIFKFFPQKDKVLLTKKILK